MSFKCIPSVLTGERRSIPLEYDVAVASGWHSEYATASGNSLEYFSADVSFEDGIEDKFVAFLDAADIRDTGSREPGALRVAYYRKTHTEAHFNNKNGTGTLMLASIDIKNC